MSQRFRKAIQDLSRNRLDSNTKILVGYDGNKSSKKFRKSIVVNDFRRVIGAGGQRQSALKDCGIPGWKLCTWMMDAPITKYWQDKAEKLAKHLGLSIPKAFDTEEG
jgi:hypothetical protein